MMYTEKFANHRYAQCYMIHYPDGASAQISYATCVAEITADGWLRVHGLYSMTTRRHLGWFGKVIGVGYGTMRDLAGTGYEMDVTTGEVRPW